MNNELRPFWSRFFSFDWKLGLFLILVVCIPRFILVLHANATGNYAAIGIIMLLSAAAPFVFLSRYGQKKIGIAKPKRYSWLAIAFFCGLIASIVLYLAGELLYGSSFENWYVYIGKSYNIPEGISGEDKKVLFMIMVITGMTFSPVGEELFFRGIVHSVFEKSLGRRTASVVDASAFALTHISHFGLVFINGNWDFLFLPTLIWVLGMFLVSILFFVFRKHSGSIIGSVVCHSAFNLGMIYCIFYLL